MNLAQRDLRGSLMHLELHSLLRIKYYFLSVEFILYCKVQIIIFLTCIVILQFSY